MEVFLRFSITFHEITENVSVALQTSVLGIEIKYSLYVILYNDHKENYTSYFAKKNIPVIQLHKFLKYLSYGY